MSHFMMIRPTCAARFMLLVLLCLYMYMPASAQQRVEPSKQAVPILVSANVQVSKARANEEHTEVIIAADPQNSKHLLACSMLSPRPGEKHSTVVYASFDGGATWGETLRSPGYWGGDPSCVYGPNGTAYVGMISRGETSVYKSKDSGKTWGEPFKLPSMDRPWVTLDNTSDRYHGRIYVYGHKQVGRLNPEGNSIAGIGLWRSPDGGATFLGPIQLGIPDPGLVNVGNGATLSDGTFLAIGVQIDDNDVYSAHQTAPYKAMGRIIIMSSKDGGQTFSQPIQISDIYWNSERQETSGVIPALAADSTNGVFKDRLYAVWSDIRSGRAEVMASHSSDKGKTWSKPIVISDAMPRPDIPGAPEAFMPAVAVNSSGVVGVLWYDRRDNPGSLDYRPRFSASLDGGETFLPSVNISESGHSFSRAPQLPLVATVGVEAIGEKPKIFVGVEPMQLRGGDTSGLATAPDGVFHPLWVDNRTGIAQVWTAPVKVSGQAVQNGSVELSGMADVTGNVDVILTPAVYERARRIIAFDIRLKNRSKQAFQAPMMLRVLSLGSKFGRISVANSDNHIDHAGAVYDFTQQLENGVLNPGEESRPRRLEFRVTELAGADKSWKALTRMIEVQVKVLAPASSH